MKIIFTAIATSVLTATLTTLVLQHRMLPNPVVMPQVLTLHELRIVDDAGVVRARLGTEKSGRGGQIPVLELIPAGSRRGGATLQLDGEGLGTLYFNTPNTEAKVIVGHYWGCDSEPDTEEHCGAWGMNIMNHRPKGDAPQDVGLLVGSNGIAYLPRQRR